MTHAMPTMPEVPRDFGFTDTHRLLIESARRFLGERFDKEALRALHDGKPSATALHTEVAQLGWLDAEALGHLDAALLCEELGRALCPVPVASCLIAGQLLHGGGRTDEAQRIASGDLIAAVVSDATHAVVPRGTKRVLWSAGGTRWHVADVGEATEDTTVDPTRSGIRVDLSSLPASESFDAELDVAAVQARERTLLAAECVGAAEAALSMTRDYACERKQFGRPIGTFQAVSHPIVNAMIAVEGARSLTLAAAAALDASEPAAILASMAKAAASDTLRDATTRGIQLHGGFGFTWECDMHFFFRRSLHDHAVLGSPTALRAQLLTQLVGER